MLKYFKFKKFKKRLDLDYIMVQYFIGLDAPVVKSHGGTDYMGFLILLMFAIE